MNEELFYALMAFLLIVGFITYRIDERNRKKFFREWQEELEEALRREEED